MTNHPPQITKKWSKIWIDPPPTDIKMREKIESEDWGIVPQNPAAQYLEAFEISRGMSSRILVKDSRGSGGYQGIVPRTSSEAPSAHFMCIQFIYSHQCLFLFYLSHPQRIDRARETTSFVTRNWTSGLPTFFFFCSIFLLISITASWRWNEAKGEKREREPTKNK